MNGKQAKRLRRGVRALTVGQPWHAGYVRDPHTGGARMHPRSSRKLYQRAKRAFRRYGRYIAAERNRRKIKAGKIPRDQVLRRG